MSVNNGRLTDSNHHTCSSERHPHGGDKHMQACKQWNNAFILYFHVFEENSNKNGNVCGEEVYENLHSALCSDSCS